MPLRRRNCHEVGKAAEPERGDAREDLALVRNLVGKDEVERGDAVGSDHASARKNTPSGWILVEAQLLETVEDHVDARQERPRVEDAVKLLGAERARGISLELLSERGAGLALLNLVPGRHVKAGTFYFFRTKKSFGTIK